MPEKEPSEKVVETKRPRKRFRRWSVVSEILVVFLLLVVLGVGAFVWRLHDRPLDIGFAKPTLENALYDSKTGIHPKFEKVVLHWPDLSGPVLLGLQGAKVYNRDKTTILSVSEAAISLNKSKLFLGQVSPEALILRTPSLRVVRHKDNSFDFGFEMTQESQKPENSQAHEELTAIIVRMMARPNSIGEDEGPLVDLKIFEIADARVVVDDQVMDSSWLLPDFDVSFQSVETGLYARYAVTLPVSMENPDAPDATLSGDLSFDWESQHTQIKAELKDFELGLLGQKIPSLSVLKDQSAVFNASVEASLDADFNLREVQGTANSTGLNHEQLVALMPKALESENAYEWIVDKMSQGVYSDLQAAFKLRGSQGEGGEDGAFSVDVDELKASFAYDTLSVDYRSPLPPVTKAKGTAQFDYVAELFTVDIESAELAGLQVENSKVELSRIIEEGAGMAKLDVKLNGPVKAVLDYIALEPIEIKPDLQVAKVEGVTSATITMGFPTKKDLLVEDIALSVEGTIRDAVLPGVVKDLTLRGGPFNVSVKDNDFNFSGKGMLGEQPIDLKYHEFLKSEGQKHSSRIEANLTASQALRVRMGIDLSDFLAGPAGLSVVYTKKSDGSALADVKADITDARLYFEPIAYEKAAGQAGEVSLLAHLKDDVLREISGLTASGPGLKIENSNFAFREVNGETELASGDVSRFVAGESVGKLDFKIEPSGLIELSMVGPFLDLRPFLGDGEEEEVGPKNNPPVKASIAVDTMRTADQESVQYAKLYVDVDGQGNFNQLEMDAIAGKGDIYMRYKPDETGKRVFRLEADDAGAVLKAFQVYDNIVGGKLVIYGVPERGFYDRNLEGQAEMTNFKVVKAPSLARLIGALSLPGLAATLNGEGLGFTKLAADFEWVFDPDGSVLVLKDGRTSGNSLGLTFEGSFDNAINKIDVTGTIIPLSEVNNIIGSIPLVGDILTGGSGGIFAATYKIKGQGEQEPDVSVNPLSVLAPGILRKILFEGGMEAPAQKK